MTNKHDKDLEELMKSATEGNSDNFNNNEENDKKSTKKAVIFTSIGLLIFGAVMVTGALMNKNSTEFENKTETPEWVGKEKEEEAPRVKHNYPVEIHDWAKTVYDKDTFWNQDGIEKEILQSSKDLGTFYHSIAWMNSGLPHEYENEDLAGPYTNDISKMYLDDGEDNPDFSYTLLEDYEKAYMVYMERLLNPTFGDWADSQKNNYDDVIYSSSFNKLKDMFSREWWDNNVKQNEDYSSIPAFVEWKKGDWDKYNLTNMINTNGHFYGIINETEQKQIEVENLGNDNEGQPIINVKTPVEYYAFNEDGEKEVAKGVLELTLQSNVDDMDYVNRVIISQSSLTLVE